MEIMRVYHNDPAIKAEYLARVRKHRELDQIIQGYGYWRDGKGCAVGCTIHGDSHAAYEAELGIPRAIARLEDGLFESLPNELAMEWPEKFLEVIPVGVDLSMVVTKFLHWLLVDPVDGAIKFAKGDGIAAIQGVADLLKRKMDGENVAAEEREVVRKFAYDAAAAAYAAYDAAYDAADDAAYDAAYDAADDAAYDAAARTNARIRQSEKLLGLLAEAPVA